ncbi:ribonuclease H-like domain, reverse transcriptase, RNA-dependent DNA polymerase [Tanacetum coccineum]
MFACFLSQEEPKTILQALKDESWVEAIQEELLQFKLQQVWILVDLPFGKKAIGTKWVFRNKSDERSIVIKNKARLVAQGFLVYQMDVKSVFLYGTIEEEVSITPIESKNPLVKDEDGVEVDVHEYRSMIGSLMYLTTSRPDIMFAVCACARDSPFELEAFSNSNYAGASLDRKSITGGCQFLGRRLISWQCKKQTIVANSTTEA